ncbi:MAG: c-type cytochrome [Neisseriaceae bacterium]
MKKTLLAVTAALTLLAACGQSTPPAEKGPNSEARSTAFKSMMPNFSTMGKMVKGDVDYDVEAFKQAAAGFTTESQVPFQHFESDGEGKDGDALPNVWTDAAGFKQAEDNFHNAVATLNDTAQTGDLDQIKVAYGNVGATCKACHDSFRKPQ